MLLQAAWILTVPPFRGSDEFDHVYRASAVADGEIVVDDWSSDGRGLFVTVPRELADAARFQCERLRYTGPENCSPTASSQSTVRAASGAGLYHPAYYWVVGTAAQPFDGAAALYAMRIVSAALCLLFIGLAAWSATRVASRWPLVAVILAASPVLVYSTTIVAPNGLEMAAGLALWASLLAVSRAPRSPYTGRLLGIALVAAVVECSLRMLGPLFVALTLLCVVVSNVSSARAIWRDRRRVVVGSAVAVLVAVAGAAAWVLANGQTGAPPGPPGGGAVNAGQLLVWNLQTIAAFPIRDQPGALVIYPIVLILVAWLVGTAVVYARRGYRSAILLAAAITLLTPLALTLATMGDRGVIWQGRYVLPFSVGVVLLSGYALSHAPLRRPGLRVVAPAALGLMVGISACLIKVRNEEVSSGTEDAWRVPPEGLLVALTVLAIALLAAAVLETSRPVTVEQEVRSKVDA